MKGHDTSLLQEKARRQIKVRLAALGRTQSDLAEAVGRTTSWVSQVLSAKRGITVDAIERIAQYFKIDAHELVGELPAIADVTSPRLDDNDWLRRRIAQLERELAIAIADRNYARNLLAIADTRPDEEP